MTGVDFDFARYIAQRRGQVEARARDGAAYAFSGERRVRRTLTSARPVAIAIEATTRMWRGAAKNDLLGTSLRVTAGQFPTVHKATSRAADRLRIEAPPVYVAPASSRIGVKALGMNDDAYVVLNAGLLENLDEDELVVVIGHELGHIQNNQVVYTTALHYLEHAAAAFVRWVVTPAIMALQSWARRAEITCDRAALLAGRDLDLTLHTTVKMALGLDKSTTANVHEYLDNLPSVKQGIGKYAELLRSQPYLPKRVAALRVFADSAFYKLHTGADPSQGLRADEVDSKVSEILRVF